MRVTTIPGISNLFKYNNIYLAGQPDLDSWDLIKELNISKVFNVRNHGEIDHAAQNHKLISLGLDFEQIPVLEQGVIDIQNVKKLSKQIRDDETYFIHCGTANRVAVWLLVFLTVYKKMDFDQAVAISRENGLQIMTFIPQIAQLGQVV